MAFGMGMWRRGLDVGRDGVLYGGRDGVRDDGDRLQKKLKAVYI